MPNPQNSQPPMLEPLAWDSPALYTKDGGRLVIPGRTQLTAGIGIREDSKTSEGIDGQTVTFLGQDAARVSMAVTVWTATQYRQLKKLLEIIRPRRPKTPEPVTLDHPQTALLGIRSVYLFSVTVPPYEPNVEWTITLEFNEWFADVDKPKAKPKTFKGGTAAATAGKGTKATAATAKGTGPGGRPSSKAAPAPPAL